MFVFGLMMLAALSVVTVAIFLTFGALVGKIGADFYDDLTKKDVADVTRGVDAVRVRGGEGGGVRIRSTQDRNRLKAMFKNALGAEGKADDD